MMTLVLIAIGPGCTESDQGVGEDNPTLEPNSEPTAEALPEPIDQHVEVFEEMLEVWESMVDVLAEVRDYESARNASPKMQALFEKFDAVLFYAEQMEPPSEEKAIRLKQKYKPLKKDAFQRYVQEFERVDKLGDDIWDTLNEDMVDPAPVPAVEWAYLDVD